MTNIPRVAVVGMGGFAQDHRSWAHELNQKGLIKHVAQVAPTFDHEDYATEIEALKRRDVIVHDTLRDMLAAQRKQIDLVTIPTGIHLHRPMTIACLEAGCHVLVEKPASGSIQDTNAMIEAMEKSDMHVTVGYQHMYREDVTQLKEWICAGRFGAIRRLKAFGSWPRTVEYYSRTNWAGKFAINDQWVLDSPHQNAMAHAINLLCYLSCDRPHEAITPKSIQAELYRANDLCTADTVSLRMQSEEGVELFFAASHCTDEQLETVFVIEAEKATIFYNYSGGGTIEWHNSVKEAVPVSVSMATDVLKEAAALSVGELNITPAPLAMAKAQSLCTCGTYESSRIHELPHNMITTDCQDSVVIFGMKEAVLEAFKEAALFSELSLPWAKPGNEINLQGYDYYPSYLLPE